MIGGARISADRMIERELIHPRQEHETTNPIDRDSVADYGDPVYQI